MDGGQYVRYHANIVSTTYIVHCRASALSRQQSGYGHRTRTRAVNSEEYRCTQTVFPCMSVHTERAADTERWFMYSFGMVVTVPSWHLGQAACVDIVCRDARGADMPVARTGRHGRADGRVHGSHDGQARPRAV